MIKIRIFVNKKYFGLIVVLLIGFSSLTNIHYLNSFQTLKQSSVISVEPYEKRINPLYPFYLYRDQMYSTQTFTYDRKPAYNQVFLIGNSVYLLFIQCLIFSFANQIVDITYKYDDGSLYIDRYIFQTQDEVELNERWKERFLIIPKYTGIYNITLTLGLPSGVTWTQFAIGIFEIPIIELNEEVKYKYWSQIGDGINLGRLSLESGFYTVMKKTSNSTHLYSQTILYQINRELVNDINGRYLRISDIDKHPEYLVNTKEKAITYLSSGEYIFYVTNINDFAISRISKPTDLSLLIIFLIVIIIVGIVVAILVYIKIRNKNKID